MEWRRMWILPLAGLIAYGAAAQEKPAPAEEAIPDLPDETAAPAAAVAVEEPAPPPQVEKTAVAVEPTGKAPDTYHIQEGDTLWDVCMRFLDNPWYWPKLWSLNQYIGNPHFIYPGGELRFYSGGVYELPKLEISKASAVEEKEVAEKKEEPAPQLKVAKSDAAAEETGPEEQAVAEVEKEVASPAAPASAAPLAETPLSTAPVAKPAAEGVRTILARPLAFISTETMKTAGRILSSFDDLTMLSLGRQAYLQLQNRKGVSPGDRFLVFEEVKKIHDPNRVFGTLGSQIQIKGVIEVTEISPTSVSGRITDSTQPLYIGDYILPYQELYKEVTPSRNPQHLLGQIVGSENDGYLIGQGDLIFVNLGEDKGIKDGNELFVVRRKDSLDDNNEKLPFLVVGKLLVLVSKKGAATALVTESQQPLEIGDKVRTDP